MKTCRTNRLEQIIEQILIVECSQRYSQHVKYTLERFKRPAAVKKIDYTPQRWLAGVLRRTSSAPSRCSSRRWRRRLRTVLKVAQHKWQVVRPSWCLRWSASESRRRYTAPQTSHWNPAPAPPMTPPLPSPRATNAAVSAVARAAAVGHDDDS